jgi:hypothetical protein
VHRLARYFPPRTARTGPTPPGASPVNGVAFLVNRTITVVHFQAATVAHAGLKSRFIVYSFPAA